MATTTYQGTTNNDTLYVHDPAGRHGETATWDGLEGTDTLFVDSRAKATFKFTQDKTDPSIIHMDGVSGASAWHYKLISIEKVDYKNTVTDLTALFPTAFPADTTAPIITTFDPVDNASGVPVNKDIVLTFDENIAKGTGNILIKDNTGTAVETYDVATSTNLTIKSNVLTINPTASLNPNTAYTVELTTGSIEDTKGNAFAGTTTYNFTTGTATITSGTAKADTLTGVAGIDVIYGLAGNDTLDGGTGADSMYGGAGKDTYIVDNSSDYIEEVYSSKPEIDTVQASVSYSLNYYVENLILTGTNNINGTGNYDKNIITGNDGNNRLDGGWDSLYPDGSNKSLIADKLVGGKGDDTYVVDLIFTTSKATLEDTITEAAKSGTDTLELGTNNGSYTGTVAARVTLANNLENLNAGSTGSNLLDLFGNGADNVITGNNAANTINGAGGNDSLLGGGGNDKLIGGKGLDTLTGGSGSDVFVFDTALNATTNLDTITDFVAGTDDIQLGKGIFAKLKNDTDLSDNIALGTALDDKDYLIYDSASGALSYDSDGKGDKAAVQFAVIGVNTHPASLTAADFLVA